MYYTYLRFKVVNAFKTATATTTKLTKLVLLVSSEQLLKEVLDHFNLQAPNGEGFLEVANAYNQAVIDLSWAAVIHGIEKNHWELLAALVASNSPIG